MSNLADHGSCARRNLKLLTSEQATHLPVTYLRTAGELRAQTAKLTASAASVAKGVKERGAKAAAANGWALLKATAAEDEAAEAAAFSKVREQDLKAAAEAQALREQQQKMAIERLFSDEVEPEYSAFDRDAARALLSRALSQASRAAPNVSGTRPPPT